MMIGNACPHQIKAKTFAMEAENKTTLPDVQSSEDERNIAINRVGVRASGCRSLLPDAKRRSIRSPTLP